MIDILVLLILSIFFILGWRKGFLRTLLGPLSLLIGCIVAVIYYQNTNELIKALIISIVGPFVINLGFTLILLIYNKATLKDQPFFTFGRLCGGLISAFWNFIIIALVLVLIVIIPVKTELFTKFQDQVLESKTYAFINSITGNSFSVSSKDFKMTTDLLNNPELLEEIRESEEFEELSENEKFQEFISDEETRKQLEEKNYGKLITNPKLHALLKDKEVIEKIMSLQKIIMKKGMREKEKQESK